MQTCRVMTQGCTNKSVNNTAMNIKIMIRVSETMNQGKSTATQFNNVLTLCSTVLLRVLSQCNISENRYYFLIREGSSCVLAAVAAAVRAASGCCNNLQSDTT